MDKDVEMRKGTDWFLVVTKSEGKDGNIRLENGGDWGKKKGEREATCQFVLGVSFWRAL